VSRTSSRRRRRSSNIWPSRWRHVPVGADSPNASSAPAVPRNGPLHPIGSCARRRWSGHAETTGCQHAAADAIVSHSGWAPVRRAMESCPAIPRSLPGPLCRGAPHGPGGDAQTSATASGPLSPGPRDRPAPGRPANPPRP
jgi:hypothetical protein